MERTGFLEKLYGGDFDEGDDINEYKQFLEYYPAEIKSSGSENRRIRPDQKEKIHHKIFKRITGS